MKINPQIAEKLQEYNIPIEQGTIVLLCIYHGFRVGRTLSEIAQQVNLTKIVERDYDGGGQTWNIALYESEINAEDKRWDWIEEFRQKFGAVKKDAIGVKKDCTIKMKRYFANNPHVRKEDVLRAADLYLHPFLSRQEDPKFLQRADYFISKVVKGGGTSDASSRLDMFIEMLKSEDTPQNDLIGQRNMKGVVL